MYANVKYSHICQTFNLGRDDVSYKFLSTHIRFYCNIFWFAKNGNSFPESFHTPVPINAPGASYCNNLYYLNKPSVTF